MHRVPNISTEPKLSKLGMIRLGVRVGTAIKEVDHFILDIEDPGLAETAQSVYGPAPKRLDVTFHTDVIDDLYRYTYQRWAKGKAGIPRLECEGNGNIAFARSSQRTCPCQHAGKECTQKMTLKVLIPRISLGGYFLLASKSANNARVIETTLRITQRQEGKLIGVPMTLLRTEGYAEVQGIKTRKHFVALLWNRSIDSLMALPGGGAAALPCPEPAADDPEKLAEGRRKVFAKLRHIAGPGLDDALLQYAEIHYGVSYTLLSLQQLREMWGAMDHDLICRIRELVPVKV